MKCVKAIKSSKNVEVGTVIRIGDTDADAKVKTGYWAYAPKSEWKAQKNPQKTTQE